MSPQPISQGKIGRISGGEEKEYYQEKEEALSNVDVSK
jgi:hypothetical protein